MAGTPTTIPGAREVLDINQAQRVVDMAPVISMLFSDKKSLTTFLDSLGVRQVFNHKFDWLTDEIIPKAHVVDVGGILAPAGQYAPDTVDLSGRSTEVYLRAGDIIRSQDTGEVMKVDATPATMAAVDVLRDIEGAAPGAIAGGSVVTKIGNAVVENSILHTAFDPDTLNSLTTQVVDDWNYTQTFRNPVGLSRRENEAKLYGGKDRAHQRMVKLLEHCEEIENMLWHGVRGTASSLGSSDTLSGGIIEHIPVANTMDIGGALTEEVFNDFLRTFSRYGNSSRKVLFASRFVCDVISSFARVSQPAAVAGPNTQRNVASGAGQTLGTQVSQYVAGVGFTADIMPAHALEGLPGDLPTGFGTGTVPSGWDGLAVLIDAETLKLAKYGSTYMQLEVDVQLPGQDGLVDSYISDVGLERGNGGHQGLMTGISG